MQSFLRNTLGRCKLHPYQARGKLRERGFEKQLYDAACTTLYMTDKRVANNKLLSSKSLLIFPYGLWDIFMAVQHNRLQLHPFYLLIWKCRSSRKFVDYSIVKWSSREFAKCGQNRTSDGRLFHAYMMRLSKHVCKYPLSRKAFLISIRDLGFVVCQFVRWVS